LACAVWPQQGGDGSGLDAEVDAVEHRRVLEGLAKTADLDHLPTARETEISPKEVRARTATVESVAEGALSVASSLRTRPLFDDRSSQAETPARTPMAIWPKAVSS